MAAVGSLLLHVFIVGVALIVLSFTADANLAHQPEPEPVTITISELPEPTPDPVKSPADLLKVPEPEFVKTTKDQESEKAPDWADHEAERNTILQTQAKPDESGDEALPSLDAKKREFVDLSNKTWDPNRGPVNQSRPSRPSQASPQEMEDQKPPEPTPPPQPSRPPEPTRTPEPSRPPEPAKPPVPSPEPKTSPVPTGVPKPTAPPDPEKLAMLKEQSRPHQPQAVPTPKPTPKPRRPLSMDSPASPPSSGDETESVESALTGTVSLKGRTAVNAAATPLGKYKAAVAKEIEERWRYYMRGRADLMTFGTIKLKFYVTPEGKVVNLQLVGNTSNESFASYTVRSITEAKLPPIPPDVRAVLDRGRMEVEYTFVLIAN